MEHNSNLTKLFKQAFTLVELLVSMVILSIIMLVAVEVINQTQKSWMQGNARIEQYREARMAFESIVQNLSQATLNTYTTYKYNNSATPTIPVNRNEAPNEYIRYSELQFKVGKAKDMFPTQASYVTSHCIFFQAPLGVSQREGYGSLDSLLCGRGYFIMESTDVAYRPAHVLQDRIRYRLMEYRPTAEKNRVYNKIYQPGDAPWYTEAGTGLIEAGETLATYAPTRPVAENILALIISPHVAPGDIEGTEEPTWIAPDYEYDSSEVVGGTSTNPQGTQYMLPPQVTVTLVAIDEASAKRLSEQYPSGTVNVIPTDIFSSAGNYQTDLKTLEDDLRDRDLSYRVFRTTIGMRNAKWADIQ